MAGESAWHISRRAVIAALTTGAATIGAPAVLRRRFRLFAQSATEYSERAIRLVQSTVVVDLLNQFQLGLKFFANHAFSPDARFGDWVGGPLRRQPLEDAERRSQRVWHRAFGAAASLQRIHNNRAGDQRLRGVEIVHMRGDFFDLLDVAGHIPLR